MIGTAWGVSLALWPPWIFAWPYIEGKRTVPDTACYIQFIETNHYITFGWFLSYIFQSAFLIFCLRQTGTAIAAFYVPVTVMIILYWGIWRETEKRKKDLPNLQAAGKKECSKRSNSSDEAMDLEDWKRTRSESSTGPDEVDSASFISVSYRTVTNFLDLFFWKIGISDFLPKSQFWNYKFLKSARGMGGGGEGHCQRFYLL